MGYFGAAIASGMTLQKVFGSLTPANLYLYDFTGLVTNSTNRAGIVDVSGNITTMKSILPGVVGVDFPSNGTAPTLANRRAVLPDAVNGHFEQSIATSDFDFMYVNAVAANIKWTTFFVANFTDTNSAGGVFGNSGVFSPNGGVAIFNDTGGTNDALAVNIDNTVGGGTNVLSGGNLGVIILGTESIFCIEVDLSLASANRVKMWRGNTAFTPTSSGSNVPMTTSTGAAFTLGDARTLGGGDMAGTLGLFAIYNGITPNRQKIMENLSAYTKVAL